MGQGKTLKKIGGSAVCPSPFVSARRPQPLKHSEKNKQHFEGSPENCLNYPKFQPSAKQQAVAYIGENRL